MHQRAKEGDSYCPPTAEHAQLQLQAVPKQLDAQWGMGHVTAPLPPPSLGDSGMGKIPHRSCQIFPYLMGLPPSLALALLAMALGYTYTQAGPASGQWVLAPGAWPCLWKHRPPP